MSLALACAFRIAGATAALAAFAAGCATPVAFELDPLNDFARYRTWAWLPPAPAPTGRSAVTPQLHAVLRGAIEHELAARGFARAAKGKRPDFFVGYDLELQTQLVIENEVRATQTLQTLHGGLGDIGAYEIGTTEQRVVTYETGVLGLDVADGQERALVWRGISRRRARNSFSDLARDAVAEIFEQFPTESAAR